MIGEKVKKRIYSFVLAGMLAVTTSSPVYAMSVLDTAIHAGSGGVSESSSVTEQTDRTKDSSESVSADASDGIGCSVPDKSAGKSGGTINEGVYAGSVDLSGLSETEAMTAVNNYVTSLGDAQITLNCVSGNQVTVPVSSFGLHWENTGIITDALSLGQTGNVIKRFKELSDLKRTSKIYPVELSVDEKKVRSVIASDCKKYDVEAQDALMSRNNGNFDITPGHDGQAVNIDSSVNKIVSYFSDDYTGESATIDLAVEVTKPKGDTETLRSLTDILGQFTTRFYSSGKDRVTNVTNGCRLINGTLLYPGEQISVSDTISPMTEENGYALAGSYLNGQVVESFGGGICQVSTTLYQAVLRAELQVDERYNHSMVVNYVDHSGDAAIAEGIKDFKFTNNMDTPIYIDGYTTPDKTITFTIYGVETRPSNRTLEFESVDLEEIEPTGGKVVADSSLAAGSTRKQAAHIGYRSELYKIVKIDGVETERTKVNSSTYQAVPATLTVGTATDDPNVKAILESAIATQDIDYCQAIASGQIAPAPTTDTTLTPEVLAALAEAAESPETEQTTVENPPD
ncbi:MAG: VanW family protein [Lachnospiraceae bacterium]|nr:VanW family protein [Lachnospiraceae bacterium]